MSIKHKNIAIVGSGLVGSLLAIYLAKKESKVSIYERREDIRKNISSSGRSINLALSDRGRKALRELGIEDKIMSISMPMYKRVIHSLKGELTEQNYGQEKQAIFSVSRKELNCLMMDLAEENGVKIHFSKKCVGVDFDTTSLKLNDSETMQFDFIFGADGAGSVVRKKMKELNGIESYNQFIDCGYKELTIPANFDGTHKIDNEALHIWPRGSFMVIALPNLDGTFTCTLFFPMEGKNSFENLKTKEDVHLFFLKEFSDLISLIPDLSIQYFESPLSSLGIIRCNPWHLSNVSLIGDACHATVPFYGQGMNSGFEDCFLLNQIIENSKNFNDFRNHLTSFFIARKKDTDAMQDLSLHNFIVMRDKTSDSNFLLQKKIEAFFSNKHPNKWMPLYSMVTFSDIGYNKAFNIGKKQEKIMKEVMQMENIYSIWNSQEVENKILSFL